MVNKSPFSFYDFLGYFIPGALFFYLFALTFQIDSLEWPNLDFLEKLNTFDKTVSFVIISYILGHAINYLSSVTIERYSIWSIGYPSKYILGKNNKCYFKKWKDTDQKKKKSVRCIELTSFLWRIGLLMIIFPMYLLDFIVGKLLGYRRNYTNSVDDSLKTIILKRIKIFRKKHRYDNGDGDYFRIIYHYTYEIFEAHRVKFDNYVALYGFTRAISFVFCVYSWMLLKGIFIATPLPNWYLPALILSCLLSYFFYLAFVKFYRRFTLEGFMCLVIDPELNGE